MGRVVTVRPEGPCGSSMLAALVPGQERGEERVWEEPTAMFGGYCGLELCMQKGAIGFALLVRGPEHGHLPKRIPLLG